MSFNPYSSPQAKDPTLPVKLAAKMYTSSTPQAPLSQAELEARTKVIPIVQTAVIPISDYDRIKAKIDRGVKLKIEGEDLVASGLREMIETKAYLKKYKSIAAFAEHEYGQTYDWVYDRIKRHLPTDEVDKAPPVKSQVGGNATHKQESEPLKEEEPEKPHIKTADEELAETTPPIDASGCLVPQHLLAIRERHEEVTQPAYWASKLKALWESIQNESDPLFAHAKNSGTVGTFMNGAASMHATLRECLPEVVCPQCQAKSKTCHTCCGSGWISEVKWNREWVKSGDRLKQTEVQRRAAIKAKYAK